MERFKDFIEQNLFLEAIGATGSYGGVATSYQGAVQKPWSAKKNDILKFWQRLRFDLPIVIEPLDDRDTTSARKSTYGQDGIRVTGSWNFIAGVLGRLKEILAYENPQTKLRLIFRQIDSTRLANLEKQAFAFYINVERRDFGKPGRKPGV